MRTRRHILAAGGGGLATLAMPSLLRAQQVEVIEMRGTPRGERIWYNPIGLAITPGTILHFVNRDPVNSHTATAYHPELFDRPARIPDGAAPWNSDFLLPDESFEVTLEVPGVYDYYCLPHEMAGMVGRIVVSRPSDLGWHGVAQDTDDLPEAALRAFPTVEAILDQSRIDPEETR
ncbi:plastocyanin [Roseovarius sp. MBR-154]|jgi:plastocyanin